MSFWLYKKNVGWLCTGLYFLFVVLSVSACRRVDRPDAAFYEEVFKDVDKKYKSGHPLQAKIYLDSIFANTNPTPYYLYMKYHSKAEWYHIELKKDSASIFLDSMIHELEDAHLDQQYPSEYASALNNKGDFYFDDHDFPRAFEYYSHSRMIARTIQDSCAFGNQSYHLGMVTYRQEKYTEAVGYFKESITETHACPDDEYRYFRLEELYSNIGLAYTNLKAYDSARLYYQLALDFTERDRKRISSYFVEGFAVKATGVIYGNLAKVYIAEHKIDTAEALLLKSIRLNDQPQGDIKDAMYTAMQLAELYYSNHKLPETIHVLNNLRSALDTLPVNDIRLRWLRLMYQYDKESGNKLDGLENLERYVALKDSLDGVNKKLKQTDFGQLLKMQEAQYQIKLLQKDNEVNHLYFIAAACLALLTIGVVILIYINYIRGRKSIRMLTLLNKRVNEQKAQLESAMSQLQLSNNDKDRILHVVAHDLRNPINAVLSLINIMMEDGVTEEQLELLKMMSSASNSSLQLIGEILAFSGDKVRKPEENKETYDISDLVKQAAVIMKFKADDKQQTISLVLSADPLYILAYPGRIERVLGNLIANAIKFSPDGGEISVTVSRKDEKVIVVVKDNGIGIPEKSKPFIFDTFTNAKRYGTSGELSFGLGLSICKQIIAGAGGRIWFESEEGAGSSFFIELPLVSK